MSNQQNGRGRVEGPTLMPSIDPKSLGTIDASPARGKFRWWLFTPDGSFLYLMASQFERKRPGLIAIVWSGGKWIIIGRMPPERRTNGNLQYLSSSDFRPC